MCPRRLCELEPTAKREAIQGPQLAAGLLRLRLAMTALAITTHSRRQATGAPRDLPSIFAIKYLPAVNDAINSPQKSFPRKKTAIAPSSSNLSAKP
jgi:hypothetical protein